MAAITDKFNKAANGTGVYPSVASVTAIREQGGSILSCDDLAGWATDTAVHFSTYRLMADGTVDTTTQSDWKGIVSGNTITQITHLAGNNDNGHLVGDKVELNPTISWLDDLITGILKSHNQDGTLKDNIIQAKHIVNGAINNTKLAAKAVKSENVDFETINLGEERLVGVLDEELVYEQTIKASPTYSAYSAIFPHNITGVKDVLLATGALLLADGSSLIFGAHSYSNGVGVNIWKAGRSNIEMIRADNFAAVQNRPHYITLRYTKDTQ